MEQPRRFTSIIEAHLWLTTTFGTWNATLDLDERVALAAYKFTAHDRLNKILRNHGEISASDAQLIAALDSALTIFTLPEPIITYRGSDSLALLTYDTGEVFTDEGYLSTSLLRQIADAFVADLPADRRVISEIIIPGGSQVGAYAAAPDLVLPMREYEILLPRDSQFRVLPADDDLIHLEVILE